MDSEKTMRTINELKPCCHQLLLVILEQKHNLMVSSKADMHIKYKFRRWFQPDPTLTLQTVMLK
jgi:hypothetical protein